MPGVNNGKLNSALLNNSELKPVIYLSSCSNRVMAPMQGSKDPRTLQQVSADLLAKAGYQLIMPEGLASQCCGMPFQSKGQFAAQNSKQQQLNDWLLIHTQNGEIPVFSDTSPCSLTLRGKLDARIKLYDSIDFISEFVLPSLTLSKLQTPVALHISCSATQLGQTEKLKQLLAACTEQIVIPEGISCCGFAGDKGFFMPELNASALSTLAEQVSKCSQGVSSSRTCEIGLSRHSGVEYQHLIYLLDKCSE